MASYTVKAGDSYASIAGDQYGNQRWLQALSEANNNRALHPGMTISIPSFDTEQDPFVSSEFIQQAGGEAAPAPTVAPAVPQTTAPALPITQPTYDVQGIQSLAGTPQGPGYDVQAIQSLGAPTPSAPTQQTYDVQSIQGIQQQPQQPSGATPTEQAAAQGGGVPTHIDPYFEDLSSGMQYLYSQWPYNVSGVGTPTELRAGGGYSPSSYQWSESPGVLQELAQGRTPVGPALAAADSVSTFLTEFGVRPEFITPFVAQSLGLSPTDMSRMGYVQDLYGRWISLEFGDVELVDGGSVGGAGLSGSGGGYSGPGSYNSPGGFRSGYTSGLINWRISF